MPLPLDELCDIIARHTPTGETAPFPKVTFRSRTTEVEPFVVVLDPMLCFVIPGAKGIIIGDRVMSYGANSILALSLHLPATGRLVEGTVAKPYLAIDLDCEMVSELLLGLSQVPAVAAEAFTASPMEATMIEPVLRLSRLADIPEDAAQLAPLLIQEILYRAIKGPIGHSCANLRVKTVARRR